MSHQNPLHVGGYPPYGKGPRGVPVPGGKDTYGATPAEAGIQEVVVHLGGGGNRGGGV